MDTQDHIDAIRNCGYDLANAIKAATDAEVSRNAEKGVATFFPACAAVLTQRPTATASKVA